MIELNRVYNKFFKIIITMSVFSLSGIGMADDRSKEKFNEILVETQHHFSRLTNDNSIYTLKRTQKSKQDFEALFGTWVLSYNYENIAYSSKLELTDYKVREDGTEGVSGKFYLDENATGEDLGCIIPDEILNNQVGTDYQCGTVVPPYRMFSLKFSGDSITKGFFAIGDTVTEVANNLSSNSVPVTGVRDSGDLPAPSGEVRFDDANKIFDWAEKTYPELFAPAGVENKTLDPWFYRYYPITDTYAGVNTSNEVWVLGNIFGGLLYIDTVDNLLKEIDSPTTPDDSPTIPASGDCVNVPFLSSGLETSYTLTGGSGANAFSGEITFNYLKVTETSMHFKQSSSTTAAGAGSFDSDIETFSSHIIKDNLLNLSDTTVTRTDSFGTNTTSEISYEPDLLTGPALVYCEGQTWESNPVTATLILDGGVPTVIEQTHSTGVVEAINETTTTPAGVYNTVRVRVTKDDSSYNVRWISTKHGDSVRTEDYNSDGSLESLLELKAVNR